MTKKKQPAVGAPAPIPTGTPAGRAENPFIDGGFYDRVRDYTERDATFSKELKAIADRGAGKLSPDARFAPSLELLRGVVKKGVSLDDMLGRIVAGEESGLWEPWLAAFGIELRGVSYAATGPRNARLALDISLGAKANPMFANAGVRNWRSLVAEDCAQLQVVKPTVELPAKAYAIFFLDAAE
jgi:hypothetical protein